MSDPLPARQDFDRLFLAYRPMVYGIALRIVRDALEAEDVAQDVFVKLWSNPPPFQRGNIESWLTVVTRNAALDYIRRTNRMRAAFPLGHCVGMATDDRSDEQAMHNVLSSQAVAALARLDPQSREVLNAVYFDDQSHSRFAAVTSTPLGTVKSRVRKGLARLRESVL